MLSFAEFVDLLEYNAGSNDTSLNPNAALYREPGLGNLPGTQNDGNRTGNAGGVVTSDQSGSEQPQHSLNHVPTHPSYDLTVNTLPTLDVKGTISDIDWFSNKYKSSITITARTDGNKTTNINLTRSQWDRMKDLNNGEEPKKGSVINIKMQKHPTDNTSKPSKIMGIGY